MNYRKFAISRALAGLLVISAGTIPAAAEERLYLSAANCIPRNANHYEGSGASGFEWEVNNAGLFTGTFVNSDDDDDQQLVCAVPYDPLLRRANGTIPTVEVTVDVWDGHAGEGVHAELFRQNGNVTAVEVDSDTSPLAGANITDSLVLTVNPTAATRYLWVLVKVPDKDSTRSGVRGCRVHRF
jgi:hypothetical protein